MKNQMNVCENQMATHGNQIKNKKTNGISENQKQCKSNEDLWESMNIYKNAMKHVANGWQFLKKQRKSLKPIYGNLWKPMEIYGNPQESMKINVND